jgi:uncharacterized protein YutE (UPF0331/DUF86 family)
VETERIKIFERLHAKAEDILGETPALFAYGIADPDSLPALRDVQLATYMDPSLPSESYFHVEIRLEALLEEILGISVAGAWILNRAPLTLQGAVLTAGRAVYSRAEEARVDFEERVWREYLDLRDMLARYGQPMEDDAVTFSPEEIRVKLEALDASIVRLRGLTEGPTTDPVTAGAQRYFFQSAVTWCLAICLHLIASLKLRPPRDFTDISEVLGEVNLLAPDLAGKLGELIGIRNRLIHDPERDPGPLHDLLSGHLATLEGFADAVRAQLQM